MAPPRPRACGRGRSLARVAALALIASPAIARADKPLPPEERRDAYSPYEQHSLEAALRQMHTTIDPAPAGKIVEGVDIIRLPVFEKRDPLDAFTVEIGTGPPFSLTPVANFFHVTSRESVIRREVLLSPGERYDQSLVDETARNLAKLSQLSLVICVPTLGGAPDRVRILVIAKDVWSLRLNSNFRVEGGKLERLLLQPSETNVAGTHQSVLFTFDLEPATYSLGGRYIIPRIGDSRLRLDVSASVIMNREEGKAEGTFGSFKYDRPLYASRAEWAWAAQIAWLQQISRRIVGGEVSTFDALATKEVDDRIPWQYKTDSVSGSYQVTRSFGSSHKHDVTAGVGASRDAYRTFDLSAFPAAARDEFVKTAIPVSDTQIGPFVEYHDYFSRFVSVLDLDTLGLQESYRRGHDLTVRVAPILRAFNSTRNFVSVDAIASYALPLGDGVARAFVRSTTELTTSGVPDGSVDAGFHLASPRTKVGRFIADARVLARYTNYLNATTDLGGDTRLRGYPSRYFRGKDLLVANVEYRSRAFEVMAVQLGGAAFFDMGDAFDGFDDMHLKYSAGVGARILFPQLERVVIRLDVGFPLRFAKVTDPRELPLVQQGGFPGDVVFTFGQAFQVIP